MIGKVAGVGVVLSLLAAVLAGPANAGVKAGPPPRSHPVAEFELKGSGGYSLSVTGAQRRVGLIAFKGLGGIVSYDARGRVTPSGVTATFGGLGRIDVEFKPNGQIKRKRPPRGCKGGLSKAYPGVFVGTIKFRGEQGFTRHSSRRAKGSMEVQPRWRCKGSGGGGNENGPALPGLGASDVTTLSATSTRERTAFVAAAWRPPEERGLTIFSAASTERRGGMLIERAAIAFSPERAFVFDTGLGTAAVSPPRPFSGAATLATEPDGTTSWSGSLKVDLPGRKGVALASPSYTASLSQPSR